MTTPTQSDIGSLDTTPTITVTTPETTVSTPTTTTTTAVTPTNTNNNTAATRAQQRLKVIAELVETETTYVILLDKMIEHWMKPLRDNNQYSKIISSADYQIIFSPHIHTIAGLHHEFLLDLQKQVTSWDNDKICIGKLIMEFANHFKMYQSYMNNHDKATARLVKLMNSKDSKLREYQNKVRKDCGGHPLQSLLILPVQRLPRYELLLKEILKYTEDTHEDQPCLLKALEELKKITQTLNERMKEFDSKLKVLKIETIFYNLYEHMDTLVAPARVFVHESTEKKHRIRAYNMKGRARPVIFFLFNDCLLWSEDKGDHRIKFRNLLPFDQAFCIDMEAVGESYRNLPCLKIYSSVESLLVSFLNKEAMLEWKGWLLERSTEEQQKMKYLISIPKENSNEEMLIAAPLFIPDDYSEMCMLCRTNKFSQSKLTINKRRHHCYWCGILVCNSCSLNRLPSLANAQEMVRACDKCHKTYGTRHKSVRSNVSLNSYLPRESIIPTNQEENENETPIGYRLPSITTDNSPPKKSDILSEEPSHSVIEDADHKEEEQKSTVMTEEEEEQKMSAEINTNLNEMEWISPELEVEEIEIEDFAENAPTTKDKNETKPSQAQSAEVWWALGMGALALGAGLALFSSSNDKDTSNKKS